MSAAQVVEKPTPGKEKPKKSSKSSEDNQQTMHVKLYSPFQIYYNDAAYSISGENETGPFDILPQHHNFMTLLGQGELSIQAPSGEQRFRIARAVMHVKADQVTVFLDV